MAVSQPRGGVIDRKSFASPYSKTFDEIRVLEEKVPREGMMFFNQSTTNLETKKIGEMIDSFEVPQVNNDNDRIPLYTPLEGNNKSFTQVGYRCGFLLTDDSVSMQKTPIIRRCLKGLPRSARKLEEMAMANFWANISGSELAGDGVAVASGSHAYVDALYGTWRNEAATGGEFSTTTYFAAWQNMTQRKGERGTPEPRTPKYVYYPSQLEEDVQKVMVSTRYPEDSLNANLPALFHQITPVRGVWLTTTPAWQIIGNGDADEKGLEFVWRVRPNYKSISDSMNPDIKFGQRLKMAFSLGAVHGRNLYYNVGTA